MTLQLPGIAPPAAGSMLVKPGGGGPIGEPWPNPGGGPETSQENVYIKAINKTKQYQRIRKRNDVKAFKNETISKHWKTKWYQRIKIRNESESNQSFRHNLHRNISTALRHGFFFIFLPLIFTAWHPKIDLFLASPKNKCLQNQNWAINSVYYFHIFTHHVKNKEKSSV